ncbi:MAG: DUF4249 domain-containing protein [Bacteroidota bacterium]
MKKLKYSLFAIILLCTASCSEDRFSQVKNIDFPEHESRLAVTANLSVPENTFFSGELLTPTLFVGHSLGILDENEYDTISNATVELFKDGNLFYEFEYDPIQNNYVGPDPDLLPIDSGTYTLEVSAPNYDKVSATQTMPSRAEVISASYEFEEVPFDFDNELYDLFEFKIQDKAGEENYYAFDLRFEVEQFGQTSEFDAFFDSDDPLMEWGYNLYQILPDVSFDGNTYDVRLLINGNWLPVNDNTMIKAVEVDVLTITKDLYLYDTSRERYWNAEGNPFAEPVLIHSNMENGYGVFTLRNKMTYRYEF